ncbi:MAG: undecaprenyl-diphosphate phosphatase [Alphaproteobacteria bacterium]|nr:MAG: undecaprenyl-diphosphate phosphatase [Alphaproteobacteria bacterium]
MPLFHLLILALVQGVTEFLPISSSAHLILVPAVGGWQDQGVLIDIAAHVGTLAAVLVYFHRDTVGLFWAAFGAVGLAPARRRVAGTVHARLFWSLVVATLPVVIAGLALTVTFGEAVLRRADVIAWASIGFGLLLYVVDQRAPREKTIERMALRPALLVGLAQVLALIPGTSRAGITMTAARGLGFTRPEAARFSMLLAIPTILAAGTLGAIELARHGGDADWLAAGVVALVSFATALGAIHFLMRWLQHASMTIFVVYRLLLGVAILVWIS